MKITIYAPSINLSPEIHDYLKKKIDGLEKFLPRSRDKKLDRSMTEIRIRIERESAHNNLYRISAETVLPKRVVAVNAQDQDIFKAIDQIKDILRREFRKYDGRKEAVHLRARRAVKRMRLWTGERIPKGKRERHE